MRPSALIDAGALIALLDSSDEWHRACCQAFVNLRLPLLTSEAVLTEVFHIVGRRREPEAVWGFLATGAVTVGAITDSDLPLLRQLMSQYSDLPMDFADATLVHLAQSAQIPTIFTVDFEDFEVYRLHGRRRFRILPERMARLR